MKFHDGSDLTAEDAVASLKRWMKLASRGKQAAGFIESVEAAGPSSLKITLKQPYAPLMSLLAFNNSAAIIISAKKQDEPMKEFIGTGPYMLKERKADQYIQPVSYTHLDVYKRQSPHCPSSRRTQCPLPISARPSGCAPSSTSPGR